MTLRFACILYFLRSKIKKTIYTWPPRFFLCRCKEILRRLDTWLGLNLISPFLNVASLFEEGFSFCVLSAGGVSSLVGNFSSSKRRPSLCWFACSAISTASLRILSYHYFNENLIVLTKRFIFILSVTSGYHVYKRVASFWRI